MFNLPLFCLTSGQKVWVMGKKIGKTTAFMASLDHSLAERSKDEHIRWCSDDAPEAEQLKCIRA